MASLLDLYPTLADMCGFEIPTDLDDLKLYDMLHVAGGIGEHVEVSAEQPEVVARIRHHLRANKVVARYSSLPPRKD